MLQRIFYCCDRTMLLVLHVSHRFHHIFFGTRLELQDQDAVFLTYLLTGLKISPPETEGETDHTQELHARSQTAFNQILIPCFCLFCIFSSFCFFFCCQRIKYKTWLRAVLNRIFTYFCCFFFCCKHLASFQNCISSCSTDFEESRFFRSSNFHFNLI